MNPLAQKLPINSFGVSSASLIGIHNVLESFFYMIKSSRSTLKIAMQYLGSKWSSDTELRRKYYTDFSNLLNLASERGVNVRIIGTFTKSNRLLREMINSRNIKLKSLDNLYLRFVIKDDSECLIVTSEQYSENLFLYKGFWTISGQLTDILGALFEELWKK
ncbi:MAG: hypothetical protein QXQ46_10865 [Thermoplasmatales archaeon]